MFVKNNPKQAFNFPILIIISAVPIFGLAIWFIADPVRATRLDRYILYHVDELLRYGYIKMSFYNPWVFLNPYAKLGYVAVNSLFLHTLFLGISSLRIVSSLFSLGVLFLIYKITHKIKLSDTSSSLALLLTLTFSVYFLASISALVEIMFCFFLIYAVYLLYCKRYFLSTLMVSLLPLIRQEGVVFILIWLLLLPRKLKIKYGLFLLLPFLIWSLLNKVLLGHPFFYTFFCNLPDQAPPNCVASLFQFFHIAGVLCIHPIFITCFIGLIVSYRKAEYRYLSIPFISYVTVIIVANILHLIDAKAFSREIRFLVPVIPFMAIYGASAFEYLLNGRKILKKYFLLFSVAMLPFIAIYQIGQLQRDLTVIGDSLNQDKEVLTKKVGYWLNDYMKTNKIKNIYVPGDLIPDKIIRRLWIYLQGSIDYYAIIGPMESYKPKGLQPLDMATYTIVPSVKGMRGVFITKKQYDKNENILGEVDCVSLRTEASLPLFIYFIRSPDKLLN